MNVGRHKTILFLVWIFAVHAQPSSAQDAVQQIEEVERIWMSAIADGDQSTYDKLLTDDFSWTYVSGRVVNRQEMIEAIGPVEIKESNKEIRVYADSAVVTGIASLTAQGRPLTERFVRVWIKETDDDWHLAYFQATEIE